MMFRRWVDGIFASSAAEPITFGAECVSIEARASEDAKTRTFSVTAYNGGPLVVSKYKMPVVIDLAGLEFDDRIVANLDHDPNRRVGHVTEPTNDGRKVTLTGVVSAQSPSAEEFTASYDQGFPWQASVEVLPIGDLEAVAEGEPVKVNGQTVEGPVLIARRSRMYGVGFLSRGADPATTVSLAASAADPLGAGDMKFEEWIKAMALDPQKLTDRQRDKLREHYDKIEAAAPPVTAPQFDAGDIVAAAAQYDADIHGVLAEFDGKVKDKDAAEIKAKALKAANELRAQAIREKWPVPRYEAECVKARSEMKVELIRAERHPAPAIHASTRDVDATVIEAALAIQRNLPNLESHYSGQTLESASHRSLRSFGLQQLIMGAAAGAGYVCRPGERLTADNLRTVMQHAFAPIHAAQSTVSLSGVLSNLANKELLEGWNVGDQTWREVAMVKSVNDFKVHTSYRLLDQMEYEELGPRGEIAHGKLGEESYTRQAKTYAKMFLLSREDIINDDLGAFDDLRMRLGKGAILKFNKVFWGAFLDNSSFFTAGRGNYISGSDSVLDATGLQKGVTAFHKLKTPEGEFAELMPDRLLVPPELEVEAQELFVSTRHNTGGASSKTRVPDANTFAGKYRPIVCRYLSDTRLTGNSTTAWYLLGDPAMLATMVVAFLNGQQSPTVESADADFSTLGIQFRGYHDFGVTAAEYLAGVKSKGAS